MTSRRTEGNNIDSDSWAFEREQRGLERSGDAIDSYHCFEEDMRLLADAGLNAYRFGVEWARIEPVPGHISRAELAHYRRMIDTAGSLGLTPVITLHHFSSPRWFAEEGGWLGAQAVDRFTRYVETVTGILGDVPWIATINEPNMLAMTAERLQMSRPSDASRGLASADNARAKLPAPDPEIGAVLVKAHYTAREVVRANTDAAVGWTIASRALAARPGAQDKLREIEYVWEDLYLEAARGDDFVGVQSYTSDWVGPEGIEPRPPHPDNTMVGKAYRLDALGMAVRHIWDVAGGVPVLVTENGIPTTDDSWRIAYIQGALNGLFAAIDDGVDVDVRGYLHWSALDNFHWGDWKPTFGLIAVDRETFERHPKPSLACLGDVARRGRP